jgi:hypothetical protein
MEEQDKKVNFLLPPIWWKILSSGRTSQNSSYLHLFITLSLQFDLFLGFPKKSLPNTNSKFWKKVEEDFF